MQPNELVWLWVCPDVTVEVDVVPRPQVVGVKGAAQAQAHRGRVWGRGLQDKVSAKFGRVSNGKEFWSEDCKRWNANLASCWRSILHYDEKLCRQNFVCVKWAK